MWDGFYASIYVNKNAAVCIAFQITDATLGLFALHCPHLSVLVSHLLLFVTQC